MSINPRLLVALGFVAALCLGPASAGAWEEDSCRYHGTDYSCEDYCANGISCTIEAECPCWPAGLPDVEPYLCFDAPWVFDNFGIAIVPPATPTLFQASFLFCRAGPVLVPTFLMGPGQIEACDEDVTHFCDGEDACERKCECDDEWDSDATE